MMAEKPPMMGEGDGRWAEVVNGVAVGVEKVSQNAEDNSVDEAVGDGAMVVEVIESPQIQITGVEDEKHMAVDIFPVKTPTAESVSSDYVNPAVVGLPATTVQSSAADIIDVDAIDSCDEARNEKLYGNPLEQGLNEYYLKPTAVDSPATNVIDVDVELLEVAADNHAVIPETATSVADKLSAGNSKNKTSPESIEEKSCTDETSDVSVEPGSKTLGDGLSDVEARGVETIVTFPLSSVAQDKAQSVDEILEGADISNKLVEGGGANIDAASIAGVEGPNAEPEVASSTEEEKLEAADVDEVFADVTGQAVAEQEFTDSTDKDVAIVVGQAGMNTETDMASPEVEVLAAPSTLPTEDVSVCKTEAGLGKPAVNVEESFREEKAIDLIEASSTETPTGNNEAQAEVDKTENTANATDRVDMMEEAGSNTAEFVEMKDKPVFDAEPANQPAEAMDVVVVDGESVKEEEEISDSVEVRLDSEEGVANNINEVISSDAMEQADNDVSQPLEIIEEVEVDISSEDVEQPTEMNERVDVRTTAAADDTTKSEDVQFKDVTDKPVSDDAEASRKTVANEGRISSDTKASDNVKHSRTSAETDHSEDTEGISGDTVATNNADTIHKNVPYLEEMKHVAVADKDDHELPQKDATRTTKDNNVVDSNELAGTNASVAVESGTVKPAEMLEVLASDQQCNRKAADVADKMAVDGKDVTVADVEHAPPEKGCDRVGGIGMDATELTTDEKSAVLNEACANRKTDYE